MKEPLRLWMPDDKGEMQVTLLEDEHADQYVYLDDYRELESKLEKTENQNRFLRSWIRELREDGADAVSVDPLYGMLRDRITELAKEDPAADSPEGARLTALAELCEAYETRRGESAVGAPEVNSKSRLKRVAMQRAARESAGVERQEPESTG